MSLDITLLGTGSPMADPNRAGPATLVRAGGEHYLVDCGRGVLMRLAAAGVPVGQLTAVCITHLHSDHITDLNDVITSMWITTFEPTPLRIIGPPGTEEVVGHILASLGPDIGYRLAHHPDLTEPPLLQITETDGAGQPDLSVGSVRITTAPTDHRPVEPSIAFRFDHGEVGVVVAGDTVPCAGLDELCSGAQALVHTVIRKDIITNIPVPRLQDTLDYHSSPEEAAQTAERAGLNTLVLTHYVPPIPPGGGDDWRALAAQHFTGRVELGDDLHHITIT
ncbi:MAG TPA: ribonuclease Z [Ilumatobacteraceae bacterium]|nr:ribonuclease Z [Ilumatobacteraceae bacterium]